MTDPHYKDDKEIKKHVREALLNYLGTDEPWTGYDGYSYTLHENGDATIYPYGYIGGKKETFRPFIVHVY